MKLWRISQLENTEHDTYDEAVVAAKTEDDARKTLPGEGAGTWTAPEHVVVEYVGTAKPGTKAGVVVASFRAG